MRTFFSTLTAVCTLLVCTALAGAGGMTLEQVADLRSVSAAVISPRGDTIAYTLSVPRKLVVEDDGSAWTELHVIDEDGTHRPFVTGEVSVSSIGWMPDGSAITFLSKREGDEHTRLYAIPLSGGEARPIATLETAISSYSFSPDGDSVALLAFEPEDPELEKERKLGFDQYAFEEEWKPRRVYIHELGDADAEPRMLEIEGSAQRAAWSPDGDRLAISVTPRQLVDDTLMFQRLRIVSPEGAEIGRMDNPGKLGEFAWSPDGEHLAFISGETIHDPSAGRLMVAGKDGGAMTNLLPDLMGQVEAIEWHTPSTLRFIVHEGVEARVGDVDLDGNPEETRFRLGGPIWSDLSIARGNGRMALLASTPEHPTEVYRFGFGVGSPQRMTNSNPWLSEVDFAYQEVVTYEARDGLEIEGILVYPLGFEPGKRYPLILAVHGGPEAHYSNGWLTRYSLPAQPAAAEGYFMFFQNYRGSTGRGVEFSMLSQGRYAKEEFDDLVDGVDYLIGAELVDGDRVGITGGSYGGYASAWGATYYSDRFAAAVMFVGISEQFSKFGTTDIPQEMYLVHARQWPWENWDLFAEASPIRYAERAQTPILIMHGDSDPRVDPRQSEILYRYLTLQENPPPVRLVFYKGEGHGNRRAASRYDYSRRMMRWMDHYLKGPGGAPPPVRIDYGLDVDE
ncbi:MAG TPA: S9 family peptidase [Microbacterium sp.]|nr:S9 family peptidase [Microbacterium sp.]